MPEAARQHERIAEPKSRRGSGLPAAAEEIVLSPRVVDRLAFDEYVRLLKGEIERATTESELLARRAEAGAVILEQLDRFMTDNGEAIEHAAEVLAGVDQRMTAAHDLIDEVERRAGRLHRASAEAESAIDARAEAFQSRLRSIVDTAMDRFEETEDQLTARAASARRELLERLEQMRLRGTETIGKLDASAAELTRDAEETVARAEARLEALRPPARELLASIDARTAALAAGVDEHAQRITAIADATTDRVAEAARDAQTTLDAIQEAARQADATPNAVREACEAVVLDARTKADALLNDFGDEAASITQRGAELLDRARSSAIEELTATRDEMRATERSLNAALTAAKRAAESDGVRGVLDRCAEATAAVDSISGDVASLEAQAKTARESLDDAILSGAERIDKLDARAAMLKAAGAPECERLAALLAAVKATTESDLVDRLVERVKQESRAELHEQLEMATASLAALSERVRRLEADDTPQKERATARKASAKTPAKAPAKTPGRAAPKKKASKKAGSRKTAATKQAGDAAGAATTVEPKATPKHADPSTGEMEAKPKGDPSSKPAA